LRAGIAMRGQRGDGEQGAGERAGEGFHGAMDLHGVRDSTVNQSLLQHFALGYRCAMFMRRAVSGWRQWPLLAALCALLGSPNVHAAWLQREEAIMGTRCAVEL